MGALRNTRRGKARRGLLVLLVAALVAVNLSGAVSLGMLALEAQAAEAGGDAVAGGIVVGEVAVAAESAAERGECPFCPSELRQGACDEERCVFGLVQDPVPGTLAVPAERGGPPGDDLFGLARGPEPTPPRAFG